MRYIMFVKMTPGHDAPPATLMSAVEAEIKQQAADGILLDAGGYGPIHELRLAGGEVTTTDGPFSETKEVIGGFSLFEVRTRDEAVEQARRMIALHQEFWPGQDVAIEVREVAGGPAEE